MLAIGRGLMAQPQLILLDEPTLGLSPLMAQELFELVERLGADGMTLLLAEQDIHRTLQVAQQAYVVENGRIAAQGPSEAIAGDPRIRQAYLGL
jgi:branched-chain amino acid transport system ATP-binding protein